MDGAARRKKRGGTLRGKKQPLAEDAENNKQQQTTTAAPPPRKKQWVPLASLDTILSSDAISAEDLFPLSAQRCRQFLQAADSTSLEPYRLPPLRASTDDQVDWTGLVVPGTFKFCGAELGRGTYGIVRRLRHQATGNEYAVKSIPKVSVSTSGVTHQVETEASVQLTLKHRNLLKCFACVEDHDYVHLILDCCSNGDLYSLLRTRPQRRFSEHEAFFFFMQLVNGLRHLHRHGYSHRDLKLENLLVTDDYTLKIADFGWVARILGKQRNFNFCGTLDYLAPEMVHGCGHDWRVDVWGAGVILHEMVTGRPPFQSTGHHDLTFKVLIGRFARPKHISPELYDLMSRLLEPNLNQRITFEGVLRTPWVKRMWSTLMERSIRASFVPKADSSTENGPPQPRA